MSTIRDYINGFFISETKITKRVFMILFLIYFAESNVYYFSRPLFLSLTMNDTSQADLMLFFLDVMMTLSIVLGSFFLKKIRKLTVIYVWAMTLIMTTLFLMGVQGSYSQLFLIYIQGIFLGLCVLAFNVYFCSQTRIEERGRVGGTIVSLSLFLSTLLSLFLVGRLSPNLIMVFLGICTLMVCLLKPEKESLITEGKTTYADKKNFLLYYIPWMMFSLNNATFQLIAQRQVFQLFTEFTTLINIMKFFGACFGALIGGFISDRVGRKPILMFGLTSLGLVSTLAGLTVTVEIFILRYLLEGFTWGLFLVLYYLFIWEELNKGRGRNLYYYSIGLSTFHLSRALGFLINPLLSEISVTTASLISTTIILVSNIPLTLANETLPKQYKSEITDLKKTINRIKKELTKITGEK